MLKFLSLALMLVLAPVAAASAQEWALDGMDPVAYRSQGAAVPGRSNIVTHWAGLDWHFASEDNRAAFEANPRAFAPGFRGYCPTLLALKGRATPGDPRYFVVVGQRLYLFSSPDSRTRFLAEPRALLMKAKAAFIGLRD